MQEGHGDFGKNEEALVVDDKGKPAGSLGNAPAEQTVPMTVVPGGGSPAQEGHPSTLENRHIPEGPFGQNPKAQGVMGLHEFVLSEPSSFGTGRSIRVSNRSGSRKWGG